MSKVLNVFILCKKEKEGIGAVAWMAYRRPIEPQDYQTYCGSNILTGSISSRLIGQTV